MFLPQLYIIAAKSYSLDNTTFLPSQGMDTLQRQHSKYVTDLYIFTRSIFSDLVLSFINLHFKTYFGAWTVQEIIKNYRIKNVRKQMSIIPKNTPRQSEKFFK